MPSRWISVEPEERLEETGPTVLDQKDVDAITAQVPTLSVAITERVQTGTLTTDHGEVDAKICGTVPDYLRLLAEQARVQVKQGEFLDSSDIENKKDVLVLSETLAEKLFTDTNPVGQSIKLGDRKLVVIGVTSRGADWASDLIYDGYVPHTLFEPNSELDSSPKYDRLRFKAKTLDDAKFANELIRKIIERRHPDKKIRVQ
ncbi:ABC transporter permease [Stieleria sp. ICT_E10.1]|uniref:ABC transporter permease n=1 Tax=Stieleria sedimenti TaxID=2976331 RepID=UPI00217FB8B7|nr:ABC transporter permease [Stieleria sedimenti]MCS7468727.1 ABC transporter permease [Stieleria sedimenti]